MLLKDIKKCNISIYDCPKLTNELYIEDSKMMLIKLLETQIFDKFWPSKVKLSSNEPELLKPKLELLEQKSSERDTCSNLTVWNSMKLELDKT